ncbi:hypothetical protein BWI17_04060 [Betaproteobacteria bacterium GR16-43]|nr:hypothetical protein BWI17_04060 [Betaproteobacteria bacterium GR16-43]
MERNTALAAVIITCATATIAFASLAAYAEASDPGPQAGDPPRWYVPADTPAKKYATLMKEAGAALQEARIECRQLYGSAAERSRCEADARAQYEADKRRAQGFLRGDQG